MIVDHPRSVDRSFKVSISFVGVNFELQCLHAYDVNILLRSRMNEFIEHAYILRMNHACSTHHARKIR